MKRKGICMIVLTTLTLVFLGMNLVLAGDIPLLKTQELKKMMDEGRADIVVVDTQPKVAYDMGHIPGAVNLPCDTEIESVNVPRDKMLVLYCACTHEEDATDVANQLIDKFGYENIKLLEGGWLQWVKLGFPVEKK